MTLHFYFCPPFPPLNFYRYVNYDCPVSLLSWLMVIIWLLLYDHFGLCVSSVSAILCEFQEVKDIYIKTIVFLSGPLFLFAANHVNLSSYHLHHHHDIQRRPRIINPQTYDNIVAGLLPD